MEQKIHRLYFRQYTSLKRVVPMDNKGPKRSELTAKMDGKVKIDINSKRSGKALK